MPTGIQRAANMLEANGYLIGWIREDPKEGIVAFLDPHTLKPEWSGPKLFGLARFSRRELDSFDSTQILHRVRQAGDQLLDDLREYEAEEQAVIRGHALKLSSILCATLLLTQIF